MFLALNNMFLFYANRILINTKNNNKDRFILKALFSKYLPWSILKYTYRVQNENKIILKNTKFYFLFFIMFENDQILHTFVFYMLLIF